MGVSPLRALDEGFAGRYTHIRFPARAKSQKGFLNSYSLHNLRTDFRYLQSLPYQLKRYFR
jgi:hypothetical protein